MFSTGIAKMGESKKFNLTTQQLNNSATGLGQAKAAVVLGDLGVSAVTGNRKDVQVRRCKAMWESELRRNSGFRCVAVRQWLERRSFHKSICCRVLAHMPDRSHHEIRVAGRRPEVRTRRGTFCHGVPRGDAVSRVCYGATARQRTLFLCDPADVPLPCGSGRPVYRISGLTIPNGGATVTRDGPGVAGIVHWNERAREV